MINNLKNTLSLSEMKSIKGGIAADGTCGYLKSNGDYKCGVDKQTARNAVVNGGNWCCDSCPTTAYCGEVSMPEWPWDYIR